jgi:trigger factor
VELTINNKKGLDAVLSVKIQEADYREDFEKSLKEHGRKMNVPGFRPGKIPTGVIKKLIGKDAKRELVEKFLQKSIQDYLDTNNIKLVLSPLSTYLAEDIDWQQNDLEFTYDIGMRPEIKLHLKPLNKLTKYKVDLTEDEVKDDVMKMRRQSGKMNPAEGFENNTDHYISIKFTELDDNAEPVDGGVEKTKRFTDNNLPKKLVALLEGQGTGFETVVKIADILSPDEMADLLEIEPANVKDLFPDFRISIMSVMKIELPEMNEYFYKNYFPDGNVATEEQFNAEWKKMMERYLESQANNILAKDVNKSLLADTDMDMPEEFVKKYFLLSYEKNDVSEIEDYEKKYEGFKEELKWMVLAEYITEQNNIEITEEEVIHYTEDMIRNEFGRSGYADVEDKQLRQYAIDYLTKENNFNRTSMALRDGKVFDWLLAQIEPKVETVSFKKFEEIRKNH